MRFFLSLCAVFLVLGHAQHGQAEDASLIVKNATIVTMDDERRVIRDGVLVVQGDRSGGRC